LIRALFAGLFARADTRQGPRCDLSAPALPPVSVCHALIAGDTLWQTAAIRPANTAYTGRDWLFPPFRRVLPLNLPFHSSFHFFRQKWQFRQIFRFSPLH
jgi:hypothetical protein